jgi:LacI family transcriptional regulator
MNTHATVQDIAQMAQVPLNQVIKVVLGQPDVPDVTRRAVLETMKSVGFIKIPNMQSTAGTLGLVLPSRVRDDYIGDIARGASEAAKGCGYSLIINTQNHSFADDLTPLFGEDGCDGIIMVVPHNYQQLIHLSHKHNARYVLVDYQGDDDVTNVPTIEVNNYQAMLKVMNHLFGLGHRRIGFITGRLVHVSAQQRLQAYRDALTQAGIAFSPELVGEGDWEHPLAHEQAARMLRLPRPPTAIVASNDLSAFGAMHAAHEVGLTVGENFSVTGFDDISMASTVTPALTTVRQPTVDMSKLAVEMLIKQLRGEKITNLHAQLNAPLIIRESTAPVQPIDKLIHK